MKNQNHFNRHKFEGKKHKKTQITGCRELRSTLMQTQRNNQHKRTWNFVLQSVLHDKIRPEAYMFTCGFKYVKQPLCQAYSSEHWKQLVQVLFDLFEYRIN